IPAHFAMLAFCGVLASAYSVVQFGAGFPLLVINLLLVIATGTRTPSALAVVIIVFVSSRLLLRSRVSRGLQNGLQGLLLLASLAIGAWAFLPQYLLRSATVGGGLSMNTSGRGEAWKFFYENAMD